ncbi:helix-turn-helix domain-containing protein [Flavobacterium nitrogenifigens]|uniref:Transcriptional regulator, AraC family n=1 Tax=Flavobacterium nitrogenifigens TaxID=1617283 RepID=A0A521F878_9FLAO|nr:AraC family transcriptional regulator [Flavobacterium nitrogenifigens]KAF2337816.1 helix-turn-helix transcriptional regulator [Flavobacterium nitrogenifigens]SMO92412.1 transcriptional regulator, AraC family [Flavobacterium nitrogenifigens]
MLQNLLTRRFDELGEGFAVHAIKKYEFKNSLQAVFETQNFSILLVRSGSLTIQFSDAVYKAGKNDLLLIPGKLSCRVIGMGNRFQFYLVSFSSVSALKSMYQGEAPHWLYFFIWNHPLKTSLASGDFTMLSLAYELMYNIFKNKQQGNFSAALWRLGFDIFLYELLAIYSVQNFNAMLPVRRNEDLAIRFFTVLSIHSRNRHNVKFYAGALCISSAHLNRILKEVTGMSAKRIIMEAVAADALILLKESKLTIAEIAEALEFDSISSFSSFFKKSTSVSPSEYRSKCP